MPAATPSPDNERARRRAPRRARGEPAGPVEVERRRVPGFRRVRGFGRYPLVASGLTIAHDSRFCSQHPRFSAAAPVSVAAYRREAGRLLIVTSTIRRRPAHRTVKSMSVLRRKPRVARRTAANRHPDSPGIWRAPSRQRVGAVARAPARAPYCKTVLAVQTDALPSAAFGV